MSVKEAKYQYTEAAEYLKSIEGWVCKNCGRYWGIDDHGEHMARYCCTREHVCDMCGVIVKGGYTRCEACREKVRAERYAKLERRDWDGDAPLCDWDSDRFFWSAEQLIDYLTDEAISLDSIRLCFAEEGKPPVFDFASLLEDHLPDDADLPDGYEKLEAHVNAFLKKHAPYCYWGSNVVPTRSSLVEHIGEDDLAEINKRVAEREADEAEEASLAAASEKGW